MTAAELSVCFRDLAAARRAVATARHAVDGVRDAERFVEIAEAALADAVKCFELHHATPAFVPPSPFDDLDADEPDTEVYGEPVGAGAVIAWPETRPEPAAPAAG